MQNIGLGEEYIECKWCNEEFDPNDPYHLQIGYRNECHDCAVKHKTDVKKVKAFTGFNNDGDWLGIEIVSGEHFDKVKRMEEYYGKEPTSSDRETED